MSQNTAWAPAASAASARPPWARGWTVSLSGRWRRSVSAQRSSPKKIAEQLGGDGLGLSAVGAGRRRAGAGSRATWRPRRWSSSGSTSSARSSSWSAVPLSWRARVEAGISARWAGRPRRAAPTGGRRRGCRSSPRRAAPAEGEARDQQRDRKPMPATAATPPSPGQLTGGAGPEPRPWPATSADDPGRLSDHVAVTIPRRPGAEGVAEQAAAERDAGVGQREERHDHVARPRVQAVSRRSLAEIAETSSAARYGRASGWAAGRTAEVSRWRARGRRGPAGRRWSPGRWPARRWSGGCPT